LGEGAARRKIKSRTYSRALTESPIRKKLKNFTACTQKGGNRTLEKRRRGEPAREGSGQRLKWILRAVKNKQGRGGSNGTTTRLENLLNKEKGTRRRASRPDTRRVRAGAGLLKKAGGDEKKGLPKNINEGKKRERGKASFAAVKESGGRKELKAKKKKGGVPERENSCGELKT